MSTKMTTSRSVILKNMVSFLVCLLCVQKHKHRKGHQRNANTKVHPVFTDVLAWAWCSLGGL